MRTILVSLAVLLLPIAVSGAATASTCATDPGAFFCEDWEKFTVGTSPAEWSLHPPGFTATIVTPGLNGTGKRLEGTVPPNAVPYPGGSGNGWIANGSCEGCPGGDHAMSASVPQGSRYWLEFTITYSPDYRWGYFPNQQIPGSQPGNCASKVLDWHSGTPNGRLLFTVWGCPPNPNVANQASMQTSGPAGLMMSMYPNYGPRGTDPGANTNCCTEKFSNTGTSVPFFAGGTYHIVMEVLVGTGATGAYKIWINGTKTHDFSGLQTSEANPWVFTSMGIGGPLALPNPGSHWSWDEIRLTTTNIAPGVVPPPGFTAPTSLSVK